MIDTPTLRRLAAESNQTMEELIASCSPQQCLKRIGTSQEIANLVVFLASDLCSYTTGANLMVDGGFTTI